MTTTRKHENHNYFSQKIIGKKNSAKFLRDARKRLKDVDFDTIVVTGMSGMGAGTLLAHYMDKNLYVIRKGEECHDWRKAFGVMGERYIFLDDLIDSGATLQRVKDHMEKVIADRYFELWDESSQKYTQVDPVMVGSYLYALSPFAKSSDPYQPHE